MLNLKNVGLNVKSNFMQRRKKVDAVNWYKNVLVPIRVKKMNLRMLIIKIKILIGNLIQIKIIGVIIQKGVLMWIIIGNITGLKETQI